jgi:hypothetical protein
MPARQALLSHRWRRSSLRDWPVSAIDIALQTRYIFASPRHDIERLGKRVSDAPLRAMLFTPRILVHLTFSPTDAYPLLERVSPYFRRSVSPDPYCYGGLATLCHYAAKCVA